MGVHLFQSNRTPGIHEALDRVTVHAIAEARAPAAASPDLKVVRWSGPDVEQDMHEIGFVSRATRARLLADLIADLDPHVIHTQETQHAAYLTLDARARLPGRRFPPWLHTNWGSDMVWYGRDPRHRERIKAVMRAVDYFHADCFRDVGIARAFGWRGRVAPVTTVAGGLDVELVRRLRRPGLTSARRDIAVKGLAGELGRPEILAEALLRCGDALAGYRLRLYLAMPESEAALSAVARQTNTELEIFARQSEPRPHAELVALHGAARVSIDISASDGLSTSFLEAAAAGSYPVRSDSSCAAEYAREGVQAALVDHRDAGAIAAAIRRALTDDALVDRAAVLNDRVFAEQLNLGAVSRRVVDAYERIAADRAISTSGIR